MKGFRIREIRKFILLLFLLLTMHQLAVAQSVETIEIIETSDAKVEQLAVKSNLLVDGAMVPNIGLEIVFVNQWSVNMNWYFAWWKNNSKHRYWQVYAGEVELRKWLGKRAKRFSLEGHHLGAYFMGGTYDFEWGYKGYRSNFSYNVGLAYGYGVKIAKSLYLDFGLGVGFIGGTYKKYIPEGNHYCVVKEKRRRYFGPSKAEISLVWAFGDLFLNKQKGGIYEIDVY